MKSQHSLTRFSSRTIIVIAALVIGGLTTTAAPEQANAQEGLEAVLQGLKWRAPKETVLKYFKKSKDAEFRDEVGSIRDSILKERLRKKKIEEYKDIEESWVDLKGAGRTGYEVSVVSGEFKKNNGEALMRVRDDRSQKFYFFNNNRLWKLAIVYNADYLSGIGFEAFVDQVVRKYGDSDESEYDGEGYLARAMWRDEHTELRIEDKSDFFGTFVMVFSELETLEKRRSNEEAFGSREDKNNLRKDIEDIKEDDGFSSDSNIVDRLVGTNVEVNLERGRPEQHEVRRVGSKPVAKEETKKKKKKKGRRAGARKKKGKKADDLIIY